MEKQKKKQRGITLIALVISIIVMLILAGVSLSMTIGENGIVTKAQEANFANKIVIYKEELEMNIVRDIGADNLYSRRQITLLGQNVKRYISGLHDGDEKKFAIIGGELYYIGSDDKEEKVAKNLGINTKPIDMSVEEYAKEVESRAIENLLMNLNGDSFKNTDSEGESNKVGIELKNKVFGNDWKIIVEVINNETIATYGSGWTYIQEGTTIDGIGKLTQSYIVDFNNKKFVKFDGTKHTMLSYGSKLAVTNGLFFEVSPTMIEEKELIEDVKYGGYSNFEEAYTDYSFIFDGVNDYIEIPYDESTKIIDGFTFQFYGKFLSEGTNYRECGNNFIYNEEKGTMEPREDWNEYISNLEDDEIVDKSPSPNYPTSPVTYESEASGIMCAWGPLYKKDMYLNEKGIWTTNGGWDSFIRFSLTNRISDGAKGFIYNIGHKKKEDSYLTEYSAPNHVFNQQIFFEDLGIDNYKFGNDINITVSINAKNYTQTYYVNGSPVSSGSISTTMWSEFLNEVSSRITKYFLGRSSYDNTWHYGNMEVYGIALYNRGLNDTEVLANNNAMVSYHNLLVDKSNGVTGGQTGGSDMP